jgi:acyl-coenzyme A synthetase/AMP-(fatty) acid ligase
MKITGQKLPKTAAGKVQKLVLRSRLRAASRDSQAA